MKTLLILRHAKSSWKDPGLIDHERPLNKRGQRAAPDMGRLILQRQLTPELILSSTAVRARRTAELVAEHCHYPGDLRFIDDLYMASPNTFLTYLRQLPDEVTRALVVGHNPGIEELITVLTGQAPIMPTAALAQVELPVSSWSLVLPTKAGTLVGVWRPRDLS